MKRFIIFFLILVMAFTLGACGNKRVDKEEASNNPIYTVDVEELDPNIYPDNYPLIAFSDFESAFEILKQANVKATLDTYQEVVDIFGVDGAYYEKCDYDQNGTRYKYYGWYADNGVSILITFKANGNKLEYFAYTSNGII